MCLMSPSSLVRVAAIAAWHPRVSTRPQLQKHVVKKEVYHITWARQPCRPHTRLREATSPRKGVPTSAAPLGSVPKTATQGQTLSPVIGTRALVDSFRY